MFFKMKVSDIWGSSKRRCSRRESKWEILPKRVRRTKEKKKDLRMKLLLMWRRIFSIRRSRLLRKTQRLKSKVWRLTSCSSLIRNMGRIKTLRPIKISCCRSWLSLRESWFWQGKKFKVLKRVLLLLIMFSLKKSWRVWSRKWWKRRPRWPWRWRISWTWTKTNSMVKSNWSKNSKS